MSHEKRKNPYELGRILNVEALQMDPLFGKRKRVNKTNIVIVCSFGHS